MVTYFKVVIGFRHILRFNGLANHLVRHVPARFEIIETHNMKCIADCPCSACRSVTAEPDIAPIDKGIASVTLLAIMAVMKYADHLPLARQATRILLRSGLQFSQSSMRRWMRRVADLLEPLYDLMLTCSNDVCDKLHRLRLTEYNEPPEKTQLFKFFHDKSMFSARNFIGAEIEDRYLSHSSLSKILTILECSCIKKILI